MRIQNNIMAMNTHRQYGVNNTNIAKSLEKLSSGYRVNRAGDDAAGLAISEKMRAQIRGLTMASKNSQDAISLVQTAEGALQSTHNILQRMRELAVQSASDTNEQTIDRAALQQEFAALIAEIDDTAAKTRFNDQNLIDGTFQKASSILGALTGLTATSFNGIDVSRAIANTYTVTIAANAAVPGSSTPGTGATGVLSAGSLTGELNAATITFAGIDTDAHNGNTYTIAVTGNDKTNMTIKLIDSNNNLVSTAVNVNASTWNDTTPTIVNFGGVGQMSIQLDTGKSGANLTVGDIESLQSMDLTMSAGTNPIVVEPKRAELSMTINGETVMLHKGDTVANFKDTGIVFSFKALSDADVASNTTFGGSGTIEVKQILGRSLIIQTGANQGDELLINIDKMSAGNLGVRYSAINTRSNASDAITEVNNALNSVSKQRAALGALQNQLEYKISNLDTSAENLQAAESRIRDLDMAKEMTNFTKQNILSQAATAMLAQANAIPQGVLQLLK